MTSSTEYHVTLVKCYNSCSVMAIVIKFAKKDRWETPMCCLSRDFEKTLCPQEIQSPNSDTKTQKHQPRSDWFVEYW